jgi:hypothetical protein
MAAACLAQMYMDTCARAKICCHRNYYTMVEKKMKAFICLFAICTRRLYVVRSTYHVARDIIYFILYTIG